MNEHRAGNGHRPQQRPPRNRHSSSVSRRAARRRQIRRNRIIFAVLVLAVIAIIVGAIVHFVRKPQSKGTPDSSSAPISTPAPTPTPQPFVPTWDTTGEEGFPYLVAVNRTSQTVTVYEKDDAGNYTVPYTSMICSTGIDTPEGKFHTSNQYDWRLLVNGVYGQYATRIDGPILFHSVPYFSQNKADLESEEYNKLGTPASLGCVRMRVIDCKWIYDNCPSGSPVVIFDGDSAMDPLGNPGFDPIDLTSANAGWDPTDPDPQNPWNIK